MTTTSLFVSSNGANSRLLALDVIANNLANSDTPGFRADSPTFGEVLARVLKGADPTANGAELNVFSRSGTPATRHSGGPFTRTDAPLDVAISGPGFFELQTPNGLRYTRAGSFQVDASGQLVSSDGHPVLGDGGPITAGGGRAQIDADGQVLGVDGLALGRLAVRIFEDPGQLVKEGANTFRAPELARRSPAEETKLLPGGIEGSNVQPMQELAKLVVLQRAFEASMQALQADDSASQRLIQEVNR